MSASDPTQLSVVALAASYRDGALDPAEVAEAHLAQLAPGDTLRLVTAERARRQAAAASRRWRRGALRGPLDGVPIVIKDLLDTAGDVTGAGSPPLFDGPPAASDAPVAARLDAAGAVFLGKSTMTELAFSGLGINPHTGTPGNPHDPSRVPGGSSSGSATAVARRLAAAAIGSDTGGSVRIPASFQGLVGLKPTDGAIPTDGAVPLSTTLDTLGPIARDVADAWVVWRAMAALPVAPLALVTGRGRFWAPPTVWREGLDDGVRRRFEGALDALRAAGHVVVEDPLPELAEVDGLFARFGSFSAYEAWAVHEELLTRDGARMDPRVVDRIRSVVDRPAADYIRLGYERNRLRRLVWAQATGFDALLAPTVAIAPPKTLPLLDDRDAFVRANSRVLRNTTVVNLLGAPAATVPVGVDEGGLPVGLMITTQPGEDAAALAWAGVVERLGPWSAT